MSIRSNVDRTALNERITIQRRSSVQDANGDITTSWSKLIEVWAKVDALKASEFHAAGATQSPGAYTVWFRADVHSRLGLTDADRFVWRGQVLDIKDVLDQQLRGRLVAITCRSNVANG